MKLFLITRTDDWDWDEYDSFVIRAENKENVLTLARAEISSWSEDTFTKENTVITELTSKGEEQIILGSFNAG